VGAPLDVLTVRKVGEPRSRYGAVAESGVAVIDHDEAARLGIDAGELAAARERALADAEEHARRHRGGRPPLELAGRTVLLVDDGIGSGRSAIAAAHTARRRGAARIVLAVPVSSSAALARVSEALDEVVCIEVGQIAHWYEHAPLVSDDEIQAALSAQHEVTMETVALPDGATGRLFLPQAARGVIVLATDLLPVAATLRDRGFATLELGAQSSAPFREAATWLRENPGTGPLGLGLFGSGATADPALAAAGECHAQAVVTAGGRPALDEVPAPATLLVVGGQDRTLLRLARAAEQRDAGDGARLAVVAGATHAFDEHGAAEQVAHLAAGWFAAHLRSSGQ
jgi:putative phosphoribosyl transferase